ncbi:MAG: glycerate kinase [Bowdeniella nasicola]|nr:glycerate kinase [Bowdeniella nasicola]
MRIVIAPDSMKGSLRADEVAAALAAGVHRVDPHIACHLIPLSDGGEGFTAALAPAMAARIVHTSVTNPLGEPWPAAFAICERPTGRLALIETAQAVGLDRLDNAKLDILTATSYGLGELIGAALDHGARDILIGLGGSATNDGGAGMLAALGAKFYDAHGAPLQVRPHDLRACRTIDLTDLDSRLANVRIRAACDVTNALLGPAGAAATFAPQKGASQPEVADLEAMLTALCHARVIGATVELGSQLPRCAATPGAGAAGGIGWALCAFLRASAEAGITLVSEILGLASAIAGADVVFTAEGAIDAQSAMGKVIGGLAQLCARYDRPLIAFGGRIEPEAAALYDAGVSALMPIVTRPSTPAQARNHARANLTAAAEAITRILRIAPPGDNEHKIAL